MKLKLIVLTLSVGLWISCGSDESDKTTLNTNKELVEADSIGKLMEAEIQRIKAETDSLRNLIKDLEH
ncbi:hypothetical protein EP331_12350 [bacterium]|nr:MAG: hypothetical protein EP331_12350 [bacterium]